MTPLFAIIVALVAAPSAHATCTWQWFGSAAATDLRTPTPWTYTWTATMSDCAGAPTTIVETDTATLSHQTYTALPATWIFNHQSGVTTVVYTYPSLIVTDFKPGDTVTDNYRFSPSTIPSLGPGGQVRLTIPVTALTTSSSVGPPPTSTLTYTASATQTSQSTSSATSAPGGQGLSSGAVGGIVTGIVIAVAACTAFAFYRYKRAGSISSQRFDRHIEIPMGERGPGKYYGEQPVAEPTYTESSEIPSGALRYPV